MELEGTVLEDGSHWALVLLAGPCPLCAECARIRGERCALGDRAPPSMEACGIDVFQTARDHGFPTQALREKTETQNICGLLLVDWSGARGRGPLRG